MKVYERHIKWQFCLSSKIINVKRDHRGGASWSSMFCLWKFFKTEPVCVYLHVAWVLFKVLKVHLPHPRGVFHTSHPSPLTEQSARIRLAALSPNAALRPAARSPGSGARAACISSSAPEADRGHPCSRQADCAVTWGGRRVMWPALGRQRRVFTCSEKGPGGPRMDPGRL